jgi:aldose 1-epimerase
MSIRSEPFGTTGDGRAVELYVLTNSNGLEARITPYGGTLVSLRVPDRAGVLGDVVLGFDTLSPYLGEHPYFGSLIGRYANRIARGRFALKGRSYSLPMNDGTNHLHGGPCGFHAVLWHAETPASETQLILSHRSMDGDAGYPAALDVQVRYALTEENELKLHYTARADAPTVLNLTNHAYFNLAGGGTIRDHVLQVHASRYLPLDSTRIPLGTVAAVRGTPFDFRRPERIGARIDEPDEQLRIGPGYDHCWVLDKAAGQMTLAAELYEPVSGRSMSVHTTQPALQVYSGNFLDSTIRGKRDVVYPKHGGLCLETQHFPDSPNQPHFPSTVLEPGEVFEHATLYRFETRPALS